MSFENIYGSIQNEILTEIKDQLLVSVTLPIDALTESVGDIYVSVSGNCNAWLQQNENNKDILAEALLNLADRVMKE